MKILNIILFALLMIGLTSCEKVFTKAQPDTDQLSIFDEYSSLIREKYAMLEFKGVDIDVLSDSIRNTIAPEITDRDLFEKVGVITKRLRDGHTVLLENKNDQNGLFAVFDLEAGFPPGIDYEILNEYVGSEKNPSIKTLDGGDIGIRALWGTLLSDQEIGYLLIPSWEVEMSDEEIEQIFVDLKNTKGLIFDMRGNGGGDPSLATKFASYFTSEPVYTGFERFKTGPDKNNFSDSNVTLQPSSSSNKYLKEVRVLTDRLVYSASTTLLYSVDPIATIKTMGQRSGGGSGSVADGYLANGWYWSMSTSEFIDAKGRHLDDGVDPDIAVALDTADRMHDEVIEAAILELQ